ncbi:MAG: hypothetical protein ACFFD4_28425, partial [Candidatus Odinarchaeota archaeon]
MEDPYKDLAIAYDKISFEHLNTERKKPLQWDWTKFRSSHKDMGYYSQELVDEIQLRFDAATKYLMGANLRNVSQEYNLKVYLIKRFAESLLRKKSID